MDQQSPFSHLFNTNYAAASNEDISVIQDLLSAPLEKLESLNSEIIRLENALSGLKAERDHLQSYVDQHRNLLSPFRRLPPEIISEIFIRCLPEDSRPTHSLSETPLLLGTICRNWREVALSTPYLWSCINVVLPTSGSMHLLCASIDRRRDGVEAWLSRAGELPLSFSIHADSQLSFRQIPSSSSQDMDERKAAFSEHTQELIGCFTRRIARWQKVILQVSPFCMQIFEASMLASAGSDWSFDEHHCLEGFSIHSIRRIPGQPVMRALPKFLAAPSLRQVAMTNVPFNLQELALMTPNLLLLNLRRGHSSRSPSPQDVFSLLSRFRNLRECSTAICFTSQATSFDSLETLCLPSLQSMSLIIIMDSAAVDVDTFFRQLSLPSLHSLTIKVFTRGAMEHAPFVDLLASSGSHIRELHLSLELPVEGLLECLAHLPLLVKLSVHNGKLHGDPGASFVRRLTPCTQQPEPLCPNLQQLSLSGIDVKDEELLKLAHSRRRSSFEVSQLEFFHVTHLGYQELIDLERRMEELREMGMKIEIKHVYQGIRPIFDADVF
ncbi:hypothetical protein D9758_000288 [Tetrapyrgos nigripes]|uniref:F-box domain-containing protein n=1 Tax=Tetrapyrgos nigripes TaxID=182062 RepID=A0A8H5LZ24_9AGAR|nr:hypothetical protein D9758_000288 [Tetrapyrgos nigripes]